MIMLPKLISYLRDFPNRKTYIGQKMEKHFDMVKGQSIDDLESALENLKPIGIRDSISMFFDTDRNGKYQATLFVYQAKDN